MSQTTAEQIVAINSIMQLPTIEQKPSYNPFEAFKTNAKKEIEINANVAKVFKFADEPNEEVSKPTTQDINDKSAAKKK